VNRGGAEAARGGALQLREGSSRGICCITKEGQSSRDRCSFKVESGSSRGGTVQ
jgi:hypothetical protein